MDKDFNYYLYDNFSDEKEIIITDKAIMIFEEIILRAIKKVSIKKQAKEPPEFTQKLKLRRHISEKIQYYLEKNLQNKQQSQNKQKYQQQLSPSKPLVNIKQQQKELEDSFIIEEEIQKKIIQEIKEQAKAQGEEVKDEELFVNDQDNILANLLKSEYQKQQKKINKSQRKDQNKFQHFEQNNDPFNLSSQKHKTFTPGMYKKKNKKIIDKENNQQKGVVKIRRKSCCCSKCGCQKDQLLHKSFQSFHSPAKKLAIDQLKHNNRTTDVDLINGQQNIKVNYIIKQKTEKHFLNPTNVMKKLFQKEEKKEILEKGEEKSTLLENSSMLNCLDNNDNSINFLNKFNNNVPANQDQQVNSNEICKKISIKAPSSLLIPSSTLNHLDLNDTNKVEKNEINNNCQLHQIHKNQIIIKKELKKNNNRSNSNTNSHNKFDSNQFEIINEVPVPQSSTLNYKRKIVRNQNNFNAAYNFANCQDLGSTNSSPLKPNTSQCRTRQQILQQKETFLKQQEKQIENHILQKSNDANAFTTPDLSHILDSKHLHFLEKKVQDQHHNQQQQKNIINQGILYQTFNNGIKTNKIVLSHNQNQINSLNNQKKQLTNCKKETMKSRHKKKQLSLRNINDNETIRNVYKTQEFHKTTQTQHNMAPNQTKVLFHQIQTKQQQQQTSSRIAICNPNAVASGTPRYNISSRGVEGEIQQINLPLIQQNTNQISTPQLNKKTAHKKSYTLDNEFQKLFIKSRENSEQQQQLHNNLILSKKLSPTKPFSTTTNANSKPIDFNQKTTFQEMEKAYNHLGHQIEKQKIKLMEYQQGNVSDKIQNAF